MLPGPEKHAEFLYDKHKIAFNKVARLRENDLKASQILFNKIITEGTSRSVHEIIDDALLVRPDNTTTNSMHRLSTALKKTNTKLVRLSRGTKRKKRISKKGYIGTMYTEAGNTR